MCAYNLVNGVRMSEHKKLYSLLRDEFKHGDRLIMSDWSAVQDRAASLKAGLDLEMPYSVDGYNRLMQAYKSGEITEEEIDKALYNTLKTRFKLGMFDENTEYDDIDYSVMLFK